MRLAARKATTAALVALMLLGAGLSACAPSAGSTVEVPVLWVANVNDTVTGGVSNARITVALTGTNSRYSVDLESDGAVSTGNAWNASAGMASAVSVLYSGQDPRGVDVSFSVSDAIDGSSAGAVLAVAVLAAIRGAKIDPKVAMTGTIGPDGSIGHVDGIEAKVRAAAQAGYTQVLVPADSVTSTSAPASTATPTSPGSGLGSRSASVPSASASAVRNASASGTDQASGEVNAPALAQELRIQVTPVSTVGQAMEYFTGSEVSPPDATLPAMNNPAQQAMSMQTTSAIAALTTTLAKFRSLLTSKQRASGAARLKQANNQIANGNINGAYATTIGTTVVVKQQLAAAATKRMIRAQGGPKAAANVIGEANAVIDHAMELIAQQATRPVIADPIQRFAQINSLTWLTRAIAVLRAVVNELAVVGGQVADQVVETAEVLAQYGVIVDAIYPDSAAIAELTTAAGPVADTDVTDFISAYADLLTSAGSANQIYYESVLTAIADYPDLNFSQPGHTYATVEQLQQATGATRPPAATSGSASSGTPTASPSLTATASSATASGSPFPSASGPGKDDTECAWALSYYLMSAYLVASQQTFGLNGSGIGNLSISTTNPATLTAALASGKQTVAAFASQLSDKDINTNHAVWTVGWGTALPTAFTGTAAETSATAAAISSTWDSSIETFMNTAALNASQHT